VLEIRLFFCDYWLPRARLLISDCFYGLANGREEGGTRHGRGNFEVRGFVSLGAGVHIPFRVLALPGGIVICYFGPLLYRELHEFIHFGVDVATHFLAEFPSFLQFLVFISINQSEMTFHLFDRVFTHFPLFCHSGHPLNLLLNVPFFHQFTADLVSSEARIWP